jgi:hypothetical protein
VPGYGTFFWNQLVTPGQNKCGEFYCELLGWKCRPIDAGAFDSHTIFSADGMDIGGMMDPTTQYSRSRPPLSQAFTAVGRACMMADPSGSAHPTNLEKASQRIDCLLSAGCDF